MENEEEVPVESTEIISSAQDFWADILRFGERLTQTWALYQLAIISITIIFCVLLARAFHPKCEKWSEDKTGIVGSISRVFVDVHRRLALLIYIPIGYSIVTLMKAYTWPSRSFFIDLSVKLACAWLIISVISSFIKNRTVRSLVMWLGWIIATLQMTGFLESTKAVLDSAALEVGDTRISVLMVMIAIFSLGALFIIASLISKAGTKRINKIEDM